MSKSYAVVGAVFGLGVMAGTIGGWIGHNRTDRGPAAIAAAVVPVPGAMGEKPSPDSAAPAAGAPEAGSLEALRNEAREPFWSQLAERSPELAAKVMHLSELSHQALAKAYGSEEKAKAAVAAAYSRGQDEFVHRSKEDLERWVKVKRELNQHPEEMEAKLGAELGRVQELLSKPAQEIQAQIAQAQKMASDPANRARWQQQQKEDESLTYDQRQAKFEARRAQWALPMSVLSKVTGWSAWD